MRVKNLAAVLCVLVAAGLVAVPATFAKPSGSLGALQQCPSPSPGSPSPTASSCPTPGPEERTVRFEASRRRIKSGRTVSLSGSVASFDPTCAVRQRVRIRRRVHGATTRYRGFQTVRTDRRGRFRIEIEVRKTADYFAFLRGTRRCEREVSDPLQIFALVRIGVRVNDHSPLRFTDFRISGTVHPDHPGTKVILQRLRNGEWVKDSGYRSQELSARSTYSYVIYASWRRSRTFRIRWPRSDFDHAASTSRRIKILTDG